jgi:hypothetical protein
MNFDLTDIATANDTIIMHKKVRNIFGYSEGHMYQQTYVWNELGSWFRQPFRFNNYIDVFAIDLYKLRTFDMNLKVKGTLPALEGKR